jgi:hypothetical protein
MSLDTIFALVKHMYMSKKKTKYNHMERIISQTAETFVDGQNSVVQNIVEKEFIEDFLGNPSTAMLKKAHRMVFANLDTALQRDEKRRELVQKYPDLPWRTRQEDPQPLACWFELTDIQRVQVFSDTPQDVNKLQKAISPLLAALKGNVEDKNTIQLAAQLFAFLRSQIKVENMMENARNNELLAEVAVQSAVSKTIDLWRFVCMPEISMVSDQKTFIEWLCNMGTERYDTLSPALKRDAELIASCKELGITPKLYFVLDDWEVPWLRSEQQFKSLSRPEQEKALDSLSSIRAQTENWIQETTQRCEITPGIVFFSSLINYQQFVDLMDAPLLESQAQYNGVFNEERRFVIESTRRKLTNEEANKKTSLRVIQYATEGGILASTFLGSGIYLNAEYPVQVVWKKLTLLSDLPTLFYVTDKEVKNV